MKLLLRLRNYGQAMLLSLVALFVLMTVTEVNAQFTKPQLPVLSLLGDQESYDNSIYPDGRIWVAPSVEGAREFLLPVFISNNWYDYADNQGNVRYVTKPITSFEFSLFYNEDAVRAIGVEQIHPSYVNAGTDYPLAYNFTCKVDDKEDDYYWYYINPDKWASNNEKTKGRRITITASSAKPLPNTDLNVFEYQTLLYVRFRIVASNQAGDPDKFNKSTPIYIDNRMVRFNEINLATDRAYKNMVNYDVDNYIKDYGVGPVPVNAYLDGLNNAPLELGGPMQDDTKWNLEPHLPGVAFLRVSDEVPEFRFTSISGDQLPVNDDKSLWELDNFISVDENSPVTVGRYIIKITNKTSTSRLTNVEIESDAPWLTFKGANVGGSKNITSKGNRNAIINYIDNGILGTNLNDPIDKPTTIDKDCYLEIICDPTKLDLKENGEKTGVHVGYITFKSASANVNPVRVKVVFVYIKNPFEPTFTKVQGQTGGINLTVSNHNDQSMNLVFGTGIRATDGVDALFGEFAWGTPLSTTQFEARWFPTNPEVLKNAPYGFGDFAPSITAPATRSRDIRNYYMPDSMNSYKFLCEFNPGPANSYPIKIQWDEKDFPAGANLYIRQVLNGEELQATNMRASTSEGGTVRSYSIFDPAVRQFVIEYTLPQNFQFVDGNGAPIIKRGWNLLSMPLLPDNTTWDVVYPHAINIPWAFVNSQYQQREVLRSGEGYFVKYPDQVDTHFGGATVKEVTTTNGIKVFAGDAPDPGDATNFGGWNLIGALSVPTSVYGISFTKADNAVIPTTDYTVKNGVYGYKTDRGYYEVSELLPGLGYWIKVNSDGFLKLIVKDTPNKTSMTDEKMSKSDVLNASTVLTIRDNSQKETNLYVNGDSKLNVSTFELPPVPPMNLFDVRYSDNKIITTSDNSVINLQGASYPVSITIENSDADYTFVDKTGKIYGSVAAGTTGSVEFTNLPYNSVTLLKQNIASVEELSLATYPNPAVNFATVNFTVPSNDTVVITLVDALGNTVKTIVNEIKTKGAYTANLDLTDVANGSYIVKVVAGTASSIVKLNVVR